MSLCLWRDCRAAVVHGEYNCWSMLACLLWPAASCTGWWSGGGQAAVGWRRVWLLAPPRRLGALLDVDDYLELRYSRLARMAAWIAFLGSLLVRSSTTCKQFPSISP